MKLSVGLPTNIKPTLAEQREISTYPQEMRKFYYTPYANIEQDHKVMVLSKDNRGEFLK